MNNSSFSSLIRTRHGMVLMELLIALFIFITVAFGLVMTLDAAFSAADQRNEIDAATRGLANQMALLHAGRIVPLDRDQPDDGSGIHYHLKVEMEQMQDQLKQPVAGMYRATITATWKLGSHDETRNISELIYQP